MNTGMDRGGGEERRGGVRGERRERKGRREREREKHAHSCSTCT